MPTGGTDRLDVFAAHAMRGLLRRQKEWSSEGLELLARASYRIALAMCAERARVDEDFVPECFEGGVTE